MSGSKSWLQTRTYWPDGFYKSPCPSKLRQSRTEAIVHSLGQSLTSDIYILFSMKSPMTTYAQLVCLVTLSCLVITTVSAEIYCLQCSSEVDPFCPFGHAQGPTRCPDPNARFCATTMIAKLGAHGGRLIRRHCATHEDDVTCRRIGNAWRCSLLCNLEDGCNNQNFLGRVIY